MSYGDGFVIAVQATAEETMVSSGVEWPDRATDDTGFARMEQRISTDPQFKNRPMPFNGKRMIFGGFTTIAEF